MATPDRLELEREGRATAVDAVNDTGFAPLDLPAGRAIDILVRDAKGSTDCGGQDQTSLGAKD